MERIPKYQFVHPLLPCHCGVNKITVVTFQTVPLDFENADCENTAKNNHPKPKIFCLNPKKNSCNFFFSGCGSEPIQNSFESFPDIFCPEFEIFWSNSEKLSNFFLISFLKSFLHLSNSVLTALL